MAAVASGAFGPQPVRALRSTWLRPIGPTCRRSVDRGVARGPGLRGGLDRGAALRSPRPLAGRRTRYRICVEASRAGIASGRSEEHTSELQSLMRISYAVFCLQKKKN